ncbi:MAG TPA: tetratricopeptide repeat-containing protein [Usitatibacter sp.]|nr:tetratricopeptide repeat-containing protein [Usitatibacter sp.]
MDALAAARESLHAGRLMEAVDEARELLAAEPGNAEALYLEALALSRLGARTVAAEILRGLLAREDMAIALRADALALHGRLLKDRAAEAGTNLASLAAEAGALYEEALRLAPSAFFAVNAATLRCLAGERDRGEALAREALRLAAAGADHDHWRAATQGECFVLLGDADAARRRYREAHARAAHRRGDVASMRRQLRLLARAIPNAADMLAELPVPKVVAFTGHMLDAARRAPSRFPPAAEPAVAAALESWLDATGEVIGYSQAACGGDILFLEALQRRGHENHVTLPCAKQDYVEQSVAFAGPAWVARFDRALAAATSVGYATAEAYLGDEILFEHASRFIDGRALVRARELEGEALMLALLDAAASGASGGALHTLEEWRRAGHDAHLLDLSALRRGLPADGPSPRAAAAVAPARRLGRRICGIAFCDVRGYSRVTEEYSPRFQERFLGLARAVIDKLGDQFLTAQTAGDGIYATFASVPALAEFCLALRERVGRIDWTDFGMPRDTNVRVAAHCGPAFPIDDPVTRQPNFCGTHVSRTARIEPVVTPGEVFATEVVAAYLALQAPRDYRCDYLGVLPLAKGFGAAPLYRLRRAGDDA